jgi:hypothetical protein
MFYSSPSAASVTKLGSPSTYPFALIAKFVEIWEDPACGEGWRRWIRSHLRIGWLSFGV